MEMKLVTEVVEESYTFKAYDIVSDGVIGAFQVLVDEKSTYLERIDVYPEHQGKGLGTQALELIAKEFGLVYAAPDNKKSKKLFERIGRSTSEFPEVDQGFGVYLL